MSIFEAFILGLVQGLAEFLPISSSGHLALLQHFFGINGEDVLFFAVMLHLGTLISVFLAYRKDIGELLLELGAVFRDLFTGKGPRITANPTRKLGFLILAATIPTAVIGFALKDFFESLYVSLAAIGTGLLITGTLLFLAERAAKGSKGVAEMKFPHGFLVGLFQAVAICPGISRSGATLVGGLACGIKRETAVKFAFLISIPSILGSVVLELPAAFREGIDPSLALPVALGVLVAAVSGLVAIKTMIRLVSGKKLIYFSFYTWVLGAAVLLYAAFG